MQFVFTAAKALPSGIVDSDHGDVKQKSWYDKDFGLVLHNNVEKHCMWTLLQFVFYSRCIYHPLICDAWGCGRDKFRSIGVIKYWNSINDYLCETTIIHPLRTISPNDWSNEIIIRLSMCPAPEMIICPLHKLDIARNYNFNSQPPLNEPAWINCL